MNRFGEHAALQQMKEDITVCFLTQNDHGAKQIKSKVQLQATQHMTCFGHVYTAVSVCKKTLNL